MYFSGFADEAGKTIELQIQATKELGWKCIEARNIDDVNITDISDASFEHVYEKLGASGVTINCFGSAVANHGKDPRKDEDFQYCLEALKRAIPRMHRLGTKMIRCMAFKAVPDTAPDSPEIEKLVFKKVSYLAKMCEDAGILYLCENCGDYSALSYRHTLRLLEAVNSPALKLIFDMGNVIGAPDRSGNPPYPLQDPWEFYLKVKEFIHYVHIKDAVYNEAEQKKTHTFPGEGQAQVVKITRDLLRSGYTGGFSIEPHLHNGFEGYLEYGRRFMSMVNMGVNPK